MKKQMDVIKHFVACKKMRVGTRIILWILKTWKGEKKKPEKQFQLLEKGSDENSEFEEHSTYSESDCGCDS